MQRSNDSKLLENLQKDYENLQEEYSLINEKYLSAIVKIEQIEKENTAVSLYCIAVHFMSCQLLGRMVILYEKSNLTKIKFFLVKFYFPVKVPSIP